MVRDTVEQRVRERFRVMSACVCHVCLPRCSQPEEIRIRFNIKNDFTPEEEEEVKRENAWCEER